MGNNLTLLEPKNLTEAMEFSKMLATSGLVPDSYKGKPSNVLVAIQWGYEVGLPPMQALNNISIINGRASIWGDAMLAVCQKHPGFAGMEEWLEGDTAFCKVKRKINDNVQETIGQFSKDQAAKANLLGKNTWKQYPERMLAMRARGFALRDAFADAIKGLITTEESNDYPDQANNGDLKRVETVKVSNEGNIASNIVNAITDSSDEEKKEPEQEVDDDFSKLEEPENKYELKLMNKPSEFFDNYEDWLDRYKAIMNGVYLSGKLDNEKKRTLLKEFEQINNVILVHECPPEQTNHLKQTRLDYNKALSAQIKESSNG